MLLCPYFCPLSQQASSRGWYVDVEGSYWESSFFLMVLPSPPPSLPSPLLTPSTPPLGVLGDTGEIFLGPLLVTVDPLPSVLAFLDFGAVM